MPDAFRMIAVIALTLAGAPAAVQPGAAPTSTPSTAAATAPVPKAASLPPLDLRDMALWNWAGKWHASQWENDFSDIPWRYDHVKQRANGDTEFVLDAAGSAELQAVNGTPASSSGLWEADVTLPELREGVIVAPLWLYNTMTKEEIDFELAGTRGLDVSLHSYDNGKHLQKTVRLMAGTNLSGRRMRFGIRYDAARSLAEMLVDGRVVHKWNKAEVGFFVSSPMRPVIEMWAAKPSNEGFVYWVGTWRGISASEKMAMVVHGYRYTPLP